jgi:hypothetical protein
MGARSRNARGSVEHPGVGEGGAATSCRKTVDLAALAIAALNDLCRVLSASTFTAARPREYSTGTRRESETGILTISQKETSRESDNRITLWSIFLNG